MSDADYIKVKKPNWKKLGRQVLQGILILGLVFVLGLLALRGISAYSMHRVIDEVCVERSELVECVRETEDV